MILKFRSEKKLPKNMKHEKNSKISTMIEKLSLYGDVGNSMPRVLVALKLLWRGHQRFNNRKPIVKMVLILRSGDILEADYTDVIS
jgi:hypothetical protein